MHEFLITNGYSALFLLSFLAATLIPLGSEWLLVALVIKGFAPLTLVLVASTGNILGACSSYYIGLVGSDFLTARLLRMSTDDRVRAERYFARYGSGCLLLSWLPVVGDPLCLVAGIMKVRVERFVLLVAIGKLARYAVVAWAALAGRHLLF
ncbi:MAG: DedA family protein [Deltaproteobacteria bacterium]|nr:MAG: DedA family protein [Deltaproteobacteria bacterium]